MQKRTESNIRDKRLVKMVKLQVKTETKRIAEMLNEMNPKLKALLAAGLIGTAGLGMQSCSNPSDPVYYPYTVEAPSTDNPGSGGGTVEEVTFEKLGVNDTDAARIADTTAITTYNGVKTGFFKDLVKDFGKEHVCLYTGKTFQYVSDVINLEDPDRIFPNLVEYAKDDYYYYIPESMKPSFNSAIDAYKASQSNQ